MQTFRKDQIDNKSRLGWAISNFVPSVNASEQNLESMVVQTGLVSMFARNVPPAALAINLILAVLLAALTWGTVSHLFSVIWVLLTGGIAVSNGWIYHKFNVLEGGLTLSRLGYWRRLFTFGALCNGFNWGIGGAVLYTPVSPLESIFVLLAISGIASGVAAAQMSLRGAFIGFVGFALLIPAISILIFWGPSQATASFLLLLYFLFIAFLGERNCRSAESSLVLEYEKDSALERLATNQRYFKTLIENDADLITVVDNSGMIEFQSPSSYTVLGIHPEELVGRSMFEFMHPDDEPEFRTNLTSLFDYPGKVYRGEARLWHRDGRWILIEGQGRIIESDPNHVVINSRDITLHRKIENDLRLAKTEAEAGNKAKSQFLANMSHEIRTPMHAILAMAELLGDTKLTAQQSKYVNSFQEAGAHLQNLISDILDFSRIESGVLEIYSSPFDLYALIDSITQLMELSAQDKGLELRVDIKPGLAAIRYGDSQRIRQIIVNLINNAIKFTPDGSISLRVVQGATSELRFEIEDTGIGIASEHKSVVFESFAQVHADNEAITVFGGAGLGLAICKRLIERMGGKIWLTSEPGKGSIFFFSLDLPAVKEDPGALAVPTIMPESAMALPKANILIVDDSAMNRMVIEEFLKETSFVVTSVSNGQAAVKAVIEQSIDLVLMDLRMPGMDGFEASQTIRKMESDGQRARIPIIALSAGVQKSDIDAAIEVGCDDFLPKPVGKEKLLAAISTQLRNH